MKLKCIITDDEPIARKGLGNYIDKIDFLELSGYCEDALQLNSLLKEQPVDLLFLDIEMPYLNGIDFVSSLSNPPRIIFTTAYEKYAIKGFELEVLDYLLKPISFERFLKAANKAHEYFLLTGKQKPEADYFFIKADNKLEKIAFDEILFIEAMENYVGIYTEENKFITHSTLKKVNESLPSAMFIQPHKSFLVNLSKVNSIEGNLLHIGKYKVPISKYQKDEVMEKILNKRLL